MQQFSMKIFQKEVFFTSEISVIPLPHTVGNISRMLDAFFVQSLCEDLHWGCAAETILMLEVCKPEMFFSCSGFAILGL